MFFNLRGAIPLALNTLVTLLLAPSQGSKGEYAGGTIAQLLESDPSYSSNTTANGNDTGSDPPVARREFQDLHRKIFAASYNDSSGQGGYNITIPADVCANTVVGDFEAPSGDFVRNGTFADIYGAMSIRSERRTNYTLTQALALEAKINTTLTDIVCAIPEQSSGRALSFRYEPGEVEGFWSAYILGGLGVTGIGFAGLHTALVQEGLLSIGNISLSQEVWVLTATALVQYIIVTAVFRLQHLRYFSRAEAFILNAFIITGEAIVTACQYLWSKACAAPGALRMGILQIAQATVNTLQAFEPRTLGTGGPSSLNLVGQDIEQGQGQVGGAEACA